MGLPDAYPEFFGHLPRWRGPSPKGSYAAPCPAHEDRSPSMSVGAGKDGRLLFRCWAGCPKAAILAAMGLGWADCFPPRDDQPRRPVPVERTHDYLGAGGEVLYRKCIVRNHDGSKVGFWQRRDRGPGVWVNGLGDHKDGTEVARVPFMLPELLSTGRRLVMVSEGERKCELLARLRFVATTGGGSHDWLPSFALDHFTGRPAWVVPDNNAAGVRWTLSVLGSLLLAGCPSVRLYRWPENTPDGWDIGDEIEACRRGGETNEQLSERVKEMVMQSREWRAG